MLPIRFSTRTPEFRDAFASILCIFCLGLIFSEFDAFERLVLFTRSHESWELDEIIICFLISPAFLGWYSYRRWQEKSFELQLRLKHEESLLNAQRDLVYQATHDSLTGLPNRALLEDRLNQLAHNTPKPETICAIAYIDLDGFKAINDQLGHSAGDKLLAIIADRFSQAVRKSDTISRIGGDEFVCLLPSISSKSDALRILDRLLQEAALPIELESTQVRISASIGVTFCHCDEKATNDELIRQADFALYDAKMKGKNCYMIYEPRSVSAFRERHQLLEQIQHGLDNNEFILNYQPQISLKSDKVIGAEALIRWNHPTKGLQLPGDFLPAIENNVLEVKLGEWVLETALSQLQLWNEQALDIAISVNISPYHLMHPSFFSKVKALSEKYPFKKSSLVLEIVENGALQDINHVKDIIIRCADIGIAFSMDDFGTGYSSLSYLRQLPLSELKVDRTFIQNILTSEQDVEILKSIHKLSQVFGCRVVIEGVEKDQQYKMLSQMGFGFAQGYLISKPLPATKFEEWIAGYAHNKKSQGNKLIKREERITQRLIDKTFTPPLVRA
ncbi:putative bifunctional diguanylate cyclase/phosphodiesterase [Parendozoicomonas haliclonae]|uniref:Phytochrome-like protein cph2 n=1 Tax=Parendozoicomonas haliclonae TaxID=1960125 RepID=A0A1X7AFE0_9GAMM|nr:GGDEF domain-containing phosphodiesterase [Parendozoicomonas haliclonae]SMA35485.1 Phytochrome-like protein cph2 [Parendozoicomonas haliclonae]